MPPDFILLVGDIVNGEKGHLHVHMHAAPARWLDRQNDIHGIVRHGIDYVDWEHPDHERYVWGNPDERVLIISLLGGKRPTAVATKELVVYQERNAGCWDQVDVRPLGRMPGRVWRE